ncbi:hypothetical protein MSG28_015873 [Choristoneura fumiferana]|uniref:Uncharacterized protein n=1 Tax=Choristoneura fumiferana TaxID=7141 RepID=A0ACC0K4H8_CHOFU|nr:hypothetical protein MSG28_015873 [Choristoneura fumiferana]
MYEELDYVDLPSGSFELVVLDTNMLRGGSIAGHERGAPHAAKALALSEAVGNLWVRATLVQQESGAGSAAAELLLLDYGELALLPVARLRKMMPEFHMKVDDRGVGTLRVARALKQQAPGDFLVEAPELIRAMTV